jgi:hypothetical protein
VEAAFGHPPLEALDAPTGVHQLLFTRIERMTVGAHLDVQLIAGGTGGELVATCAAHVSLCVAGMDLCLHCLFILAIAAQLSHEHHTIGE